MPRQAAATPIVSEDQPAARLRLGGGWLDLERPAVVGILNVTPDSFTDGGCFATLDRAVAHAEAMAADGASLIDIGGESTRPGSAPITAAEELRRVLPVIERLAGRLGVPLSVDTSQPEVMCGTRCPGLPDAHAGRSRDDAA
jgi:dihydropteroate synthase